MKHLVRLYIVLFLFASDFKLFAQPGDDDGSGGLEDDDPAPTPINGKLIWLLIIGLCFAFYYFRKYRKESTES